MIERTGTVQQRAHESALFPVGILDTALAFSELRVLTGLSRRLRKQQGAAKALGAEAVGMGELVGGVYAQARSAQGHAIMISRHLLLSRGVVLSSDSATINSSYELLAALVRGIETFQAMSRVSHTAG